MRMEHGADYDESDSRMVTQRVLELSLPDDDDGDSDGQPVHLQDLLDRYFFDNRVEQLERNLDAKYSDDKLKDSSKVRTNAWSILSMYPFYTPQSELGDSNTSYPADAPLVVPLLLKRYRVDSRGVVHRVKRSVIAPATVDVTKIVSQGSSRSTASGLNDKRDKAESVQRPHLFGPSTRAESLPLPPPYLGNE
ncbi:hypothetical protein GGI21_006026, partial [Coemansia aciculifera]